MGPMKLVGLVASCLVASAGANVVSGNYGPLKLSFNKSKGETFEKATGGSSGDVQFNLTNQQNFYSVQLQVGTPAQEVTVLLDTGSSDLWVTGSGNPYCSPSTREAHLGSAGTNFSVNATTNSTLRDASTTSSFPSASATIDCSLYGTFSLAGSETFSSNDSTFYLTYGDGSFASGTWGMDHVYLDGLDVSDVSFAVANETNSTVGVFGIGLPGDEATVTPGVDGNHYQYKNFPAVLKANGKVQKNAYSLFLNSADATEGSILFGAVDHSKYEGQLYTVPLTSNTEFDITVQAVNMQNSSSQVEVSDSSFSALLDSGTTLMYLPTIVADNIAVQLGGSYSESTGYYLIPTPSSSDDDKIVFDLGGFYIETSLSNYLMEGSSGSEDVSILGILRTDSTRAILGDVFLVDAYVVYDLEAYEISLAQASFNGTSEDIEVISSTVPGAVTAPSYASTQAIQTSQSTSSSSTSSSSSSSSLSDSSSSSSFSESSDSLDLSSSSSTWSNKRNVVQVNGVATVRADWQLLAVATLFIHLFLL